MSAEFDADFLEQVNIANLRLLSGQPQSPVDVLFFHNRSFGDYTGLYELIKELYRKGRAKFIAVTNNEGERFQSNIKYEANPGKTACIRKLTKEQHIPRSRIIIPEMHAGHTREENTAFLQLARQYGFTSGVILAQPHQLLRPMLGIVQEMDHTGYNMEIYTVSPSFSPWLEEVKGNQGLEHKPRLQHILDELQRIRAYQSIGNLASFDRLAEYLQTRENGSLIISSNEKGSARFRRSPPSS